MYLLHGSMSAGHLLLICVLSPSRYFVLVLMQKRFLQHLSLDSISLVLCPVQKYKFPGHCPWPFQRGFWWMYDKMEMVIGKG